MGEKDNRKEKFADVPIRVRSWVYILVVFSLGIINPLTMTVFVSLLSFQGMREFFRMIKPNLSFLPLLVILMCLQGYFLNFITDTAYLRYGIITVLIALIILFFVWKFSFRVLLSLGIGLCVTLISFAYLAYIRAIEYPTMSYLGLKLIIFIVVVTELNDVFQYLSGKFFGKRPVVPRISPNKTREGLIGGILMTTLLSNLLGYLLFPFYHTLTFTLIGLLLGVLGFCGDVLMSYMKRKTHVKDTGTLIPGHGGLLDRMDSLTFNAPAFFLIVQYILLK
ncbi:phosphatidate cytidylyltransferase [Sphingobacterium sp. SRCM116780]|uniref:phosphatidate cytidylyltransferase n=1 Tax=Sphingobacterium sp. SRCM116780 TaxID=2907623 RepID=UPI001F2C8803|nr:phosphatidate cytidylyltransferase [Sphingobacterium sp. SRCM116780]UIR55502.1 phosphatidate cytidylyltransferase [Sphingobacterium sp. SRCM116780]